MVIYASKKFGSEKIVRTIVLSPIHVSRGEIFTFQASARFGGKSHGYPDFKREKYNNKAESFFDLILMTTCIKVDNRERARARDQKRRRSIALEEKQDNLDQFGFCSQLTRVWRRSLGGIGGESVNSAGYSLIEQPIRARKKHYPLF